MKRNRQNTKLFCDNCQKLLIEIDTSQNSEFLAASLLAEQHRKFVVRNMLLYTNKNKWTFFCDKKCQQEYFNIFSDELKTEVNSVLDEITKRRPPLVDQINIRVAKLRNILLKNKIHKK